MKPFSCQQGEFNNQGVKDGHRIVFTWGIQLKEFTSNYSLHRLPHERKEGKSRNVSIQTP